MRTVFRTCIVLAAPWWCAGARAERAVLECISDTWIARGAAASHGRDRVLSVRPGSAALLEFRTAAIAGWKVAGATLLLHVKEGTAPDRLRVAAIAATWGEGRAGWSAAPAGRRVAVRPYGEGWIALELKPAEVTGRGLRISPAGRTPVGFDSRESVGYAPYLLVEGAAATEKR